MKILNLFIAFVVIVIISGLVMSVNTVVPPMSPITNTNPITQTQVINATNINNIYNVVQNYTNYVNTTTYVNITVYNTTTIIINATSYYGELYNDTISTLSTATQSIFYNFTSLISTELNGFTYLNNGILNCTMSGLYKVSISLSDSSANNDDATIHMTRNDAIISKSIITQRFANGNNDLGGTTFYTRINSSNLIRLQLADNTRNINTFTFNNIEVTLQWISN